MLKRPKFIKKYITIFVPLILSLQIVVAQQPTLEKDNGVFNPYNVPNQSHTDNNPYSRQLKLPNDNSLEKAKPKVGSSKFTKEQLRTAKKYARLSFIRYLNTVKKQEATREIIVELIEWHYDEINERYFIRFHIEFETIDDNFIGLQWEGQNYDFELYCDFDGKNARLINQKTKKKYIYEDIIPKVDEFEDEY